MVCVPLTIVLFVGLYTRKFVKSVADFIAANRSAGRYLLCIAGSELQTGAVVFVATFEVFSHSGFAYTWWGAIGTLVSLILVITAFVIYRFRETRALTLAQFFEIRYNKSFRLFTGCLGFFAGILNFGGIPAIGARTMVHFLGMPENLHLLSVTVPSYVVLMAVFLTVTVFVALSGGVVTVMVINTLEGIMSQVSFLVIIFTILVTFSWPQMRQVLLSQPPHQSFVNPFDTAGVKDFNFFVVIMGLFTGIIATSISWQNAGAYKSAALTAHEGRMAGVLSNWLGWGKSAVFTLLALAVITYLHHPDFAAGAAHVQATVHQIANKQAQEEMEAPIALAYLLPVGVKGMFCAVLLMGIFGGDATHLHSWGSIFIQDILVPLRKKPFGPRVHLMILRSSIVGVAFFAFLFGTFFHLADYLSMWWSVTQAIFTGGAGSAIIGGLYWKKGNAAGAWGGFITGSSLTVAGIVAQQVYRFHDQTFPLNGVQIGFFSTIAAVSVYVIVSLLTHREDFNIDRMLHRGEYAAIKNLVGDTKVAHYKQKLGLSRFIGFDDNFTLGDKWIAGSVFWWGMLLFIIFVVGSIWNIIRPWPNTLWAEYFHITSITLPVVFAVVTGVWFTWGGLRDMRALFKCLSGHRVNALDDGTVVNNQNLDEAVLKEIPPSSKV